MQQFRPRTPVIILINTVVPKGRQILLTELSVRFLHSFFVIVIFSCSFSCVPCFIFSPIPRTPRRKTENGVGICRAFECSKTFRIFSWTQRSGNSVADGHIKAHLQQQEIIFRAATGESVFAERCIHAV